MKVVIRTVVAVLLGIFTLPCLAGKLLPPRFSGDVLIEAASPNNSPSLTMEGYLAGIVDTAQGKTLCFAQAMEPSELYSTALNELKKLPRKRLRENASILITEALREKFPCGKTNEQLIPPRFTGIHLLQALEVPLSQPITTHEERKIAVHAEREREIAKGYLSGVADMARGKTWCLTQMLKPNEVDDRIFDMVGQLPQERLYENASILITETLRKRFPCK